MITGIVLSFAIFAVSGELALRVIFKGGESFGSHSGPIVRHFERDFKFNRFDGPSRGPEPSAENSPNSTRILIQGDSITWGQGIAKEQNLYSNLLLANHGDIDKAVLAKPGREIDGHLQQLRKWGAELQPDVIVYQWYINDIEIDKSQRPRREKFWHRFFLHSELARNSYLWWFLDHTISALLPTSQTYEKYLFIHFEQRGKAWQTYEQQFQEWSMLAKALTPRVLVFLYPHLELNSGEPPILKSEIAKIHDQMLSLCARENLICHDFSNRLTRFSDSDILKASDFDTHPSDKAHAEIAIFLEEKIKKSWPELFK